MDQLFLIGLTLLLGQVGSNLLRKLKIPQVVGYIVMGVLLGKSAMGWLDPEALDAVTGLALGLIGFAIGSQLHLFQLRKMGKIILWISTLEAFGAFLLVTLSLWLITGKLFQGLMFGALAAATAPAATVDVLQEYKCRGPFTTTLLAVVGIDDGIALLIYGIAAPFSKVLFMPESNLSILSSLMIPIRELGGSIVVGAVIGFLFSRGIKLLKAPSERLIVTLGVVLLGTGLSQMWHLSLIMTNMVIGLVVGNLATQQTRHLDTVIANFSPPVYILFFALVGARLDVRLLPAMGLMGLVYIIMRGCGKIGGSYLGARISGASVEVRRYLGMALFSQAGVAIGLAIAASNDFAMAGPEGAAFGALILNTITATTFVVQMVGPSLTRLAVVKAGETNA